MKRPEFVSSTGRPSFGRFSLAGDLLLDAVMIWSGIDAVGGYTLFLDPIGDRLRRPHVHRVGTEGESAGREGLTFLPQHFPPFLSHNSSFRPIRHPHPAYT